MAYFVKIKVVFNFRPRLTAIEKEFVRVSFFRLLRNLTANLTKQHVKILFFKCKDKPRSCLALHTKNNLIV